MGGTSSPRSRKNAARRVQTSALGRLSSRSKAFTLDGLTPPTAAANFACDSLRASRLVFIQFSMFFLSFPASRRR